MSGPMAATRVFAVHTDFAGEKFRTLVVPDEGARLRMLSLFPWDGASLGDHWTPPSVAFHEKAGVIPDVLHLWHPNVPALSAKAREVLGSAPCQCGELLPIEIDGQTMWIWHVTQRASCLDVDRTDVPVHGPMTLFPLGVSSFGTDLLGRLPAHARPTVPGRVS